MPKTHDPLGVHGFIGRRSRSVHFFPQVHWWKVPLNRWVQVAKGYPACSRSVQDGLIDRDPWEFTLTDKPVT